MIFQIFKKKLAKTIFISLFIAIIVAFLLSVGFLNTWEARISDAFYYPSNPLSEIIIVEIDDESIYKIGEWPFSRDNYATVIEHISESSVIGIDILFDIPREGDAEFADALKNSSVVLAVEYRDLSTKDGKVYSNEVLSPNSDLGLAGVDFKTGYINLFTDDDKVTRSIATKIYSNIEDHDSFSAVIVGEYTGVKPKLDGQRMLINYYSEPRGYTYVSFYDVYNNSENLPDFSGKIVLIGYTASGVDDTFGVPISGEAMPGVEIHANLVQSILTRDYIEYQDDFSSIVVIFIFAFITGLLLYFLKIHYATILIIVIFIAFFLIALLIIFDNYGVILNILFPLFTIVFVYITNVVVYYRTEEKSRKWITSVFGKYVSPLVIENLIKDPDKLNLGGEKKNITIFFS